MLALREIQRGKGRFSAIVSALSLIVFLVLILSALGDGLFFGATGAIRNSNATAYAFSSDAEGSLVRSRLDESQIEQFQDIEGVETAGPLGVLLTGGTSATGDLDLAVMGVEPAGPGVPKSLIEGRMPVRGETGVAAVDESLQEKGVSIGSSIFVGDVPMEVVGFVKDAQYQLQPTAWTTVETWRSMRDAVRPELRGQPTVINAIPLSIAAGTDLGSVARQVPNTAVLSNQETALAIPGVEQQRSTLNSIIYVTLAVAALVVGLFFALVVLEKRELFAALKALGAGTGKLGVGVITQAVVASVLAIVVGSVVARLFGLIIPEDVPILFRGATLVTIAIFTLVAGIVGALFSLRRIAKIDPATAIGGVL